MNTQYIRLNMVPAGVLPVMHVSQFDIGRPLGVVVYDGSAEMDLDDYTVTIEATRTDGTPITAAVTTDGNIGAFVTTATMTNKDDLYPAQLVIVDGDSNRIASLPFMMQVVKAAMDENSEAIEEDAPLYQQYNAAIQALILAVREDLNAEVTAVTNAVGAEAAARAAADTTLQSNINAEASARATQDAVLSARMDTFSSLPSGSTSGNAELLDIRVAADGTTYPSAGDAVRGQFDELNYRVDNAVVEIAKTITWQNGYINLGGTINNSSLSGFALVPMLAGESVVVGTANSNITIIGTTTANSLSVGDTVKAIQRTTSSGSYEEYSYTANQNINIVVCVRMSNYKLRFYRPASFLNGYNDLAGLETTWSNGFWNHSSKEFNTDISYQHTDYIPINEVTVPIHYTIKSVYTVASYILFDENKNYVDKNNTTSTSLIEIDDVVYDFKGASFIVFETYVGSGNTAKLRYCDITNLRVTGFIKEGTKFSQNDLTFSEFVKPENLFDYTSDDMCKPGYWYYSSSVGSVVSAVQNSNTEHYVAIKVPVYDSTKITLGIYPDDLAKLVYWVGAVDADMKLIAYSIINQNAPITYNIPAGTVYFLASYNLGSANFDTYLPRVMAVNADTITQYSSYFNPYYKLLNCKTDAEDSESITNLQSIVGSDENTVTFMLPDKYDLVVGDTFQLFYKGIINAVNPDMYYVLADCVEGNAYSRYFEVTPGAAGNISASFTLYGINHNILDTKTVTLAVHAKASSPSTTKNILCVGDSLTTGGVWTAEAYRRLTGSGGTPAGDGLTNISFIGTRTTGGAGYEAYGGWTWNSFNTGNVTNTAKVITCTHDKTEASDQHSIYRASNGSTWKLETIENSQIKIMCLSGVADTFPYSGTLTWVSGGTHHSDIVYTASANAPGNPFWDNSTNSVNFASYASRQGVSSIDYVYALVGWNCATQSYATIKEQAQTFINNVHSSFPNAKIILLGIEIPARDGLGLNYGANGIYSRYYDLMQFVFGLDTVYEELVSANSNVYHVNIAGQFDTEYNMITSTRQANTRNSEMVTYQSNGVHPATSGYYQIADAVYRDITARL